MGDLTLRKEQALEACDKVINGLEDSMISGLSALLQCKKIARLMNDEEGQLWLDYEHGGYPKSADGHILSSAWEVGREHGRTYIEKSSSSSAKSHEFMFTEMVSELEQSVESMKASVGNFSTQGFSVSGDYALAATNRMTETVSQSTSMMINQIAKNEKRLCILKSQYYEYAVKWKIQLQFERSSKSVFEEYQEKVNSFFNELPITTIRKLSAIEETLDDSNPEKYAQVLTSCRRLWSDIAKLLFSEILPNFAGHKYLTKSGREIDVSGDHDNNKLSAVIETLQSKSAKNTLVGSETIYLIDWMEQISNRQSTGVHSEVTREQAMKCIIHTYIALGDILSLKHETEKMEN